VTSSISSEGNGRNPAIAGALGQTQAAIEWLRGASPGDLDRSAVCLEAAVRELDNFREPAKGAGLGPQPAVELQALRAAVRRAGALLEHAAGYYAGWERRRGELMAGYTARGDAAMPARTSTFHISG
jgi:hypothetical protein